MPREIVNLQIGQAGNQVGEAFWGQILKEHGLDDSGAYIGSDPQQVERAHVYFNEITSGSGIKYVPRSVQIDLEGGVCNRIKSGPLGQLFRPDTFIHAEGGAGNNWAKGHYTDGAEMIDGILEVLRHQVEGCDSFQGYQILHSLGGGTGAGLGSLLLAKLREETPDCMVSTFSVFPSPKVSDTVVEPYNTLLSVHQLIDNSDLTVCIDNEALYDTAVRISGNKSPEFTHLNELIAQIMAGVSTSLRFPGQLNGDLRKISLNLIPFPRLHFLAPSYSPLVTSGSRAFQSPNVSELTTSLFEKKNVFVAVDPRHGRYLTAATIFRGAVSSHEVDNAVQQLQQKNSTAFVEWIPDNISVTICSVPPVGQKLAGTCLANTTAIQELFQRSHSQYAAMFKRRAFMHWYTGEGMDIMEFTEAESNVLDLVAEYQQYQEAGLEEEEYAEEYSQSGYAHDVEYAESAAFEGQSFVEGSVVHGSEHE
ncbi:hypothetical protein BOTBODRAFT_36712 [Botryobasidium botryosum FD-172 SS1]|uniref:Tubulin beta chain n=1 Tax=Botryobasidium botryosum (strain FD-172 SS1) TaxID=930990 RepID=A0A067M2Y2_BOTB1|nr:hypothetical protein BOTBODRAFT_36712 [Botryobasidium botryosum FD-172 SS1]